MKTNYIPGTKVWTDYPFVELGDEPCKEAPIREVTFVSYDGNKYAEIRLPNNVITEVKIGYLHINYDGVLKSRILK